VTEQDLKAKGHDQAKEKDAEKVIGKETPGRIGSVKVAEKGDKAAVSAKTVKAAIKSTVVPGKLNVPFI
jgi:hypothetical protein